MIKTTICALAIMVAGASAASAATLQFKLKDYFADYDNGFQLVEKTSEEVIDTVYVGEMSWKKQNVYTYDLAPGHYAFKLVDVYDGYIYKASLKLDGVLLGGCKHCQLEKYGNKYVAKLHFKVPEVPLPASALLLLGGLAGLGVMRRKKA